MRIEQCYIASNLNHFGNRFLNKYGLKPYTDRKKPTIFFGCYTDGSDISMVERHKSLGVVVWAGTDGVMLSRSPKKYKNVANKKNIFHIAISKWLSHDLSKHGVPHICLPICPTIFSDYGECVLGNSVYVYSSHIRPEVYNESIARKIQSKVPDIPFVFAYGTPPNHYEHSKMKGVYKKCFIGLRLTEHDGLPNTVIEMGLMGRRCVWNGHLPNCTEWKNAEDIVSTILSERKLVGRFNNGIRESVLKSINITDDWLFTEYYGEKSNA